MKLIPRLQSLVYSGINHQARRYLIPADIKFERGGCYRSVRAEGQWKTQQGPVDIILLQILTKIETGRGTEIPVRKILGYVGAVVG